MRAGSAVSTPEGSCHVTAIENELVHVTNGRGGEWAFHEHEVVEMAHESPDATLYYDALAALCPLKPGDKIKVARAAFEGEQGWPDVWMPEMTQLVGKTFIIEKAPFSFAGFNWPFFSLELMEATEGATAPLLTPTSVTPLTLRVGGTYTLQEDQGSYWNSEMKKRIGTPVTIKALSTEASDPHVWIEEDGFIYQVSAFIPQLKSDLKMDDLVVGDRYLLIFDANTSWTANMRKHIGKIVTLAGKGRTQVTIRDDNLQYKYRASSLYPLDEATAKAFISIPRAHQRTICKFAKLTRFQTTIAVDDLLLYVKTYEVDDKMKLISYELKDIEPIIPGSNYNIKTLYTAPFTISLLEGDKSDKDLHVQVTTPSDMVKSETYKILSDNTDEDDNHPQIVSLYVPKRRGRSFSVPAAVFNRNEVDLAYFLHPNTLVLNIEIDEVYIPGEFQQLMLDMFKWADKFLATTAQEFKRELYRGKVDPLIRHSIHTAREQFAQYMENLTDAERKYKHLMKRYAFMHEAQAMTDCSVTALEDKLLKDFEDMEQIDNVTNVLLTDTHILVDTKKMPIIASGPAKDQPARSGGPYQISIRYSDSELRIRSDNVVAGFDWGKGCHPHISGRGEPCLGSALEPITELSGNQEYLYLVEFILNYLQTANPDDSAGAYWDRWPLWEPES